MAERHLTLGEQQIFHDALRDSVTIVDRWQPIETAPKVVGTLLMLWDADVGHPEVASWSDNHQCWVMGYSPWDPSLNEDIIGCTVYGPTHWQPLPEPPSAGG